MPLVYHWFSHTLRPICLSQQLNHFYLQFVKTNAEFDINMLFILTIYNSHKNSTLTQQLNTVKCLLIHINSSMTTWKMRMSPLFSPVGWNTLYLTENHMLHHASCNYFGLWEIIVTTLTKTVISHSKIIIYRRSCTLLTCLKTLYRTSYLRTPVDGVASIYRGTSWCLGTT